MQTPSIRIFGEVLFDCFPDGRRILGGAPFNVSWHLQAFGAFPRFISAVGEDEEGQLIRSGMTDWGMDTTGLQIDSEHTTGRVSVRLRDGEPSYDIVPDSAYDYIQVPLAETDARGLLYHGTLALRQPVSAATLKGLKIGEPDLVFLDVNLRTPWWSREETLALVTDADWVKLNRDELGLLTEGGEGTSLSVSDQARDFLERHHLTGLVVTLGEAGALGLMAGQDPVQVAPQPALEVLDTVGAGDAFAAVIMLGILHGWSLATTLERAQSFASRIVGQRGATADSPELYQPFIERWGL